MYDAPCEANVAVPLFQMKDRYATGSISARMAGGDSSLDMLHAHDHFQILVAIEARMRHRVNLSEHGFENGTVAFIRPNIAHCLITPRTGHYIVIDVSPDLLGQFIQDPDILRPFDVQEFLSFNLDGRPAEFVRRIASELVEECCGNSCGLATVSMALTHALLAKVAHTKAKDIRELGLLSGILSAAPLKRAGNYITRHLSMPLSLRDVAGAAHVSPHHLSQLVRRHLSCTFSNWVERQRLMQACHLLKDRSMRISTVAYRCGFDDPAYFSRRFAKQFGHSPKRARAINDLQQ